MTYYRLAMTDLKADGKMERALGERGRKPPTHGRLCISTWSFNNHLTACSPHPGSVFLSAQIERMVIYILKGIVIVLVEWGSISGSDES